MSPPRDEGVSSHEVAVAPEVKRVPSYKIPLPLWAQFSRFLILFFLSIFLLAAALLVANARMPDPKEVTWLPDLFLEWLPKISWFEAFTNICIGILNVTIGYCAVKMFLLDRREAGKPDWKLPCNIPGIGNFLNWFIFGVLDSGRRPFPIKHAYLIAAIRFLTTYTVVVLYRCVTITVTAYPATDNHCQHPQVIENPLLNMLLTVVTLGSGAIHCGDLLFSGHTIILCLAFSLSWEYGQFIFKHIWLFRLYLVCVLLFAFFAILVSRSHYTNDIVVAAYSTITTYMLFRHDVDGAPWQLQILIRYWPCPFSSANPEWEARHAASIAGDNRAIEVVVESAADDDGEDEAGEVPAGAASARSGDRTPVRLTSKARSEREEQGLQAAEEADEMEMEREVHDSPRSRSPNSTRVTDVPSEVHASSGPNEDRD